MKQIDVGDGETAALAPSGAGSGAVPKKPTSTWRGYVGALGPGLVTGASDDDPSGIATYSQVGAKYGFGMLWVALISFPLMCAVQEICDRTALATGQGLGELITRRFTGAWRALIMVLVTALIVANALNIAADLVAIGAGMHLLNLGPAAVWAAAGGLVITALVIFGSFATVARVFKVLCLALLSYVAVLFVINVPWRTVAVRTVLPHFQLDRTYLGLLVAVLGTTISPYLFFWQSAHRIEELRDAPEGGMNVVAVSELTEAQALRKTRTSRLDVFSGMALSQAVMFAIIVATAVTLHSHGITQIASAEQAASALKPIAGSGSKLLFALGFIGSGMLAVPVLAGSGSAGMAGLLGRPWGFSQSPRKAPVFYALVGIGTIGGTLLTLLNVNPISLLVVVALVNGIAAAPFLLVVMIIANDDQIMGEYRNGRLAKTLGWLTVALMGAAAIATIITGGG